MMILDIEELFVKLFLLYNLSEQDLLQGFVDLFNRYELDLDSSNLQINPWHDRNSKLEEKLSSQWDKLDCEYGRVLTSTGVYACPFLANDYRGRCGSSFVDYNKKSSLETSFCGTCISSKKQLFSIDFSIFE